MIVKGIHKSRKVYIHNYDQIEGLMNGVSMNGILLLNILLPSPINYNSYFIFPLPFSPIYFMQFT